MAKDINDFFSIGQLKNGVIKITSDISNESNIYDFLHELVYCQTKLNGKRVYYKSEGRSLTNLSFSEVKEVFYDLIRNEKFANIPSFILPRDILNYCYKKDPIKCNDLFLYCFEDTLTEQEQHELRLKTDREYNRDFEIQQTFAGLNRWNFKKTIDVIGSFWKDCDLYYKDIGKNKFLIFNFVNLKNKKSFFDCSISTFTNENNIGNKTPLDIQIIIQSFHLNTDFDLIKGYIN
jgi:hypothetical protein